MLQIAPLNQRLANLGQRLWQSSSFAASIHTINCYENLRTDEPFAISFNPLRGIFTREDWFGVDAADVS